MGQLKRVVRRQVIPGVMKAWWHLFGESVPYHWVEPSDWIQSHPNQGRHVRLAESTIMLPPRRVAGSLETIDEYEQTLSEPAHRRELRKLYTGDITYGFRDEVSVIARGCCVDEAGLATAPDGYRLGGEGAYGFTDLRSDRLNLVELGYVPSPVEQDGRVAVLAGGKGYFAYYHWVMDSLPRLGRLRLAGVDVDKYYVPYSKRYHRESLEALGIDASQVIPASSLRRIQAEELVIPSALYGRSTEPECSFLFDTLADQLATGSQRTERILVSRRNAQARRILNEDEMEQALRRLGFKQYFLEELDFVSQVQLFHSADWVIGPHGAGLTNIVFCRQGTKVIELGTAYRPLTCFHEISHHRRLDYVFFLASPRNVWIHKYIPLQHNDADLHVDVPQLLALIRKMERDPDGDWEAAA